MGRARVLLAEDHNVVAAQLRALLEAEFTVTAVVSDGFGLIGAARALKPDVIVVDIGMPGMDGMDAADEIMKADGSARIVFVTVHNDLELIQRAFRLGALGYVLKQTAGEELVPAVRSALNGERFVSPLLRDQNKHDLGDGPQNNS